MTAEQARKLVDEDKERRVKAAAEAIQATLAEYQCDLIATPQIAPDGRIVGSVQIMAR